jgi:hypothetical protein
MKLRVFLSVLALGSCAAPPQPGPQGPPLEIAGGVPGPPQHCVMLNQLDALRVSENDRHTLIYGSGKTLWANHLGPSCGFGWDDVLVTTPTGSELCRGDIVRSFDRSSRLPGPSCVLNDFIPYKRP